MVDNDDSLPADSTGSRQSIDRLWNRFQCAKLRTGTGSTTTWSTGGNALWPWPSRFHLVPAGVPEKFDTGASEIVVPRHWSSVMDSQHADHEFDRLLHQECYTPAEAAELLSLSAHLVRHAARAGELDAFVVDHHVLTIHRDALLRWLEQRRQI
jgi:excisionase family DNA binding protein